MKPHSVIIEWATPQDKIDADAWPDGQCRYWLLIDADIVKELAAGQVCPELQERMQQQVQDDHLV